MKLNFIKIIIPGINDFDLVLSATGGNPKRTRLKKHLRIKTISKVHFRDFIEMASSLKNGKLMARKNSAIYSSIRHQFFR
jgi:hypothetical protein